MVSDAGKRAMKRYYEKTKKLYKVVMLRFSKTEDSDIIGKLDSEPNKTAYIKRLVRQDIRKG